MGCLEISFMYGGPMPVGFGRFPIGVGVSHGGSASSDTSNYRTPIANGADRKRKPALGFL